MTPVRRLTGKTLVLPNENVDTDQIIPARFLTTTTRAGLGRALFADWRYDAAGAVRPEFPLNAPGAEAAAILIAGRNFGCGSSREHAVWALMDHGFQVVIAPSFADIFRRNALKNGLVPVAVSEAVHGGLVRAPGSTLTVDVEGSLVELPDGSTVALAIEPFARFCLTTGQDELQFLVSQDAAIAAYEANAPAASPLQEVV